MASELVFRIGEVKRISHIVTGDETFTVDSVAIKIYNSAGTVVVNTTGSRDNGDAALEHEIYYLWNTAAVSADDYVYLLSYVVGGEERFIRGTIVVAPLVSKFDRYIQRLEINLQDTHMGEAQQMLSYRDKMQAATFAVKHYEQFHPKKVLEEVSLTSAFEYNIFDDWESKFSTVISFEYPVDDTEQVKTYLSPDEYLVDELRSKWRFTQDSPSSGETARVVYTAPHSLSHTLDTIPSAHFEAVVLRATGEALLICANKAVQTSAPDAGADVVDYGSKQKQFREQAEFYLTRAEELWGTDADTVPGDSHTAGFVSWSYGPADDGYVYF